MSEKFACEDEETFYISKVLITNFVEHFRPTDLKVGLTGHRRQLKKGSIPSLFEWAPENVIENYISRPQTDMSRIKR